MINRRRPLQDYFDAARGEPGISETEVRQLVASNAGRGIRGGGNARVQPALTIGCIVAIVAAGLFLLLRPGGDGDAGKGGAPVKPMPASTAHAGNAGPALAPNAEPGSPQPEQSPAVHAVNNNRTPIHMEIPMLSTRYIRSATAAAVAIMGAATLSAQTPATVPSMEHGHMDSPVMKLMGTEMGQAVVDYWTPKLNKYKTRIDQMLAPADLDQLNRLRVRFNVIADELLRSQKEDKRSLLDGEKEELSGIYTAVTALAARYRPQGDALGEVVKEDINGFFPVAIERVDGFTAAHRDELDQAGNTALVAKLRSHLADMSGMMRDGHGKLLLGLVYPVGIEPLLMLYDGTDLGVLIQHVSQLAAGKAGAAIPNSPIAGYILPKSTVLQQSVPNPASAHAEIAYVLGEPSSHTLLRLFNAQGDLAGTYDQGAQPAGEHSVTVDLSALPAGTYLYHLTFHTSNGDQFSSKTLQVVR